MATKIEKKKDLQTVHLIIGIAIMFIFRIFPISLPEVTDVGINVIGAFLGTLYLWIMTDTLKASLISFVMICFSGYAPLGDVLSSYMNTTLIQTIFMILMGGALTTTEVTKYIARFFLTLGINKGRPWVFATTILVASFLMAAFVEWTAPIFLFWPILYSIFEELGYKKGDTSEKFPMLLVILVVVGDLFGYHVMPFMRNPLALINNYAALTAEAPGGQVIVPDGAYLATTWLLSIILMIVVIAVCKFILRPNTEKFKNFNTDSLKANPLPPMSAVQKTVSTVYVLMIAFLMIPSLLASVIPFMKTISGYNNIMAAIAITILCIIRIEKKPVINFQQLMASSVPWPMIAMIATAFLISGALTNSATGVTAFFDYMLSPIFSNMSPGVFAIVIVIAAFILTNFCNSFVISILLCPIIASFCSLTGAYAVPFVMLLIFTSLSTAICTPSASPFAATLHGNKDWLDSKTTYKYALGIGISELIVILLVGIPLANLFS